MANTQALRRRINSTKNTRQITKAMELVAASKMRRAQEAALKTRAYRNTARDILTRLQQLDQTANLPLFDERPVRNRLYIVITSDRGLAGAYNNNILRLLTRELQRDEAENVASHAIVIGKKAAQFAAGIDKLNLIGVYTEFSDKPTVSDFRPILNTAIRLFAGDNNADTPLSTDDLNTVMDEVRIIYTDFQSSISQIATNIQLLPAKIRDENGDEIVTTEETHTDINEVVFEPNPEVVLQKIVPKLVEAQAMQALLEAIASEHSMRMVAMKSASDNASDLIDDLNLAFNSARQASITQEIAEITGGAAAIE